MKKKLLIFGSYVLVSALSVAATLGLLVWQGGDFSKLSELEAIIDTYYIEEADWTAMEDAAAAAMIAATGDRWSYYIPANEYETYQEDSENAYVGIGITIVKVDGGLHIEKVNPGSSAEEAGLLAGDIITAIEGQSTLEMAASDARNLVRGREGTDVELTVQREAESLTLSVTRRLVQVTVAVGVMLDETVGHITIANFDDRCAQETLDAIEALRAQGAERLIFDVRNNPGGYAHELVKLLDELLPEGELFRTVDYAGKVEVDTSDADFLDLPMAVLVNGDTYSAAEFFAAALREYDAAVVIGQQTTGKGHFQVTFPLSDGSAVALSIGKYYTPKGVSLEGAGIIPDVEVPVEEDVYLDIYYGRLEPQDDPQLQAALAAVKAQ